jgi:hypothetical protein
LKGFWQGKTRGRYEKHPKHYLKYIISNGCI